MRTSPSRIEVALLGALLFAVPLVEAPKHLLWLAWVIAWVLGRALRGREVLVGWGSGGWAATAFGVSALTAGLFTDAWVASLSKAGDPLRLALTLLLVAHGGYRVTQLLAVLGGALGGTLVALAWAVLDLLRSSQPAFLELQSVGHVNHSAIYLAMATGVAVGLSVAAWRDRRMRVALAIAALVQGVGLFVSASRAALGATVVFLVLFAWAAPLRGVTQRGRVRLRVAVAGAIVIAVLAYGAMVWLSPHPLQPAGEGFSEKFESRPRGAGVLAFRDKLWRVAFLAFESNPVFGIGNDRFRTLTLEDLCPEAWGGARPKAQRFWPDPCDAGSLYFAPHAHSVYANALAERGVLGLVSVVALLSVWAAAIVRGRSAGRAEAGVAGLRCASLCGLCVSALAGLLNTTLQHEHGLLAMVLMGAMLSAGQARSHPPLR